MSYANLGLGIFQDNKPMSGVYTRGLYRYIIVATDALIRHCGRVSVFYWQSLLYIVEAIQQFGPNIVGF